MDNAPYHSVQLEKVPTSSWKKAEIRDWLVKKGVQLCEDALKMELYKRANKFSAVKKYQIDKIAEEGWHRVVRLLLYHCQYNPIELIWGQIKSHSQEEYLKNGQP